MNAKNNNTDLHLLEALRASARQPAGGHLSDLTMSNYVEGRLSEETLNQLDEHLAACDECASDLEFLFQVEEPELERISATDQLPTSSPVDTTAKVGAVDASERMIFVPSHPRQGTKPVCVEPIEIAASKQWADIEFAEPEHRAFAKAFPIGRIVDGMCPLLVTTPLRAILRYQLYQDWRVVLPLALAPQQTRIVVNKRHSRLNSANFSKSLGSKKFAVADGTSTHAMRLTAYAERQNYKVDITDRPAKDRKTLYLVPMPFAKMITALERGEVDGVATVEPLPTLAKARLRSDYDEVTIEEDTIQLGRFCCVVIAPSEFVESTRYQKQFRALVDAIFRTICSLVRPDQARFDHSESQNGAARMLLTLLQKIVTKPGDRPSQLLAEELIPDPGAVDIGLELRTVLSSLPVDTLRKIRGGPGLKITEPLYDVDYLREICREAIEAAIPEIKQVIPVFHANHETNASAGSPSNLVQLLQERTGENLLNDLLSSTRLIN